MRSILWLLLGFGLFVSCGGDAKPAWVTSFHSPSIAGSKCYIGSSSNRASRELALNSAYENALTNIVKGEIPELVRISETTKENLKGNDYDRQTAVRSDLVRFSKLTEHDLSPYLEQSQSGQYNAARIYCWATDAIAAERKRLERDNFTEPPKPPPAVAAPSPRKIVIFKSMPLGATVELDGVVICVTPCTEVVAFGQHFMSMTKEGQEPCLKAVDVNAETKALFGELKNKSRW